MNNESRSDRKRKLQEELADIEKAEKIDALRESLLDYGTYFHMTEAELSNCIADAKKHCDTLIKIHDTMYGSTESSAKKWQVGGFVFRTGPTDEKTSKSESNMTIGPPTNIVQHHPMTTPTPKFAFGARPPTQKDDDKTPPARFNPNAKGVQPF